MKSHLNLLDPDPYLDQHQIAHIINIPEMFLQRSLCFIPLGSGENATNALYGNMFSRVSNSAN